MYRTIRKKFVGGMSGEGTIRFALPKGGMLMRFWLEQEGNDELDFDVFAENKHGANEIGLGNYSGDSVALAYADVAPGALRLEYSGAQLGTEYRACIEVAEGSIRHQAVELKLTDAELETERMAGSFYLRHGGQLMNVWFQGADEATIQVEIDLTALGSSPGRVDLFDSTLDVRVPAYSQWETASPGTYEIRSTDADRDPDVPYVVHVYTFHDGALG